MTINDIFGLLGFIAFLTHATVSFRNNPRLPIWLGRGLKPEDRSVHLRVSLCNLYYCLLMFGIGTGILNPTQGLLKYMLIVAAIFPASQFIMRGNLFGRTFKG